MKPESAIKVIFALMFLAILTYFYWEEEINDYLDSQNPPKLNIRKSAIEYEATSRSD